MSTDRSTRTTKDARRDAARDRARQMREEVARKQRRRRVVGLSAGVVVLLAVVAVVALVVTSSRAGSASAAATPPGVTASGGIVTGPASAAHTVTIYQDYQCPICKQFDTTTGPWLEQQRAAGTTKIEYRPISILDRLSGGTQYSTRSANAAFCVAGAQGADFTKFNDEMYAQQPEENGTGLPDSRLVTIAKDAGADVGTCITGSAHDRFVTSTTNTALAATSSGGGGVTGTPTVLVDGKVLANSQGGPPSQAQLAQALGVSS